MNEKTAVSLMVENDLAPSIARVDVVSQSSSSFVDEVVSLLKGHLTSQLEGKRKQFERSTTSDKEAPDFKYQGIRKHFEVNLRLDKILSQIDESISNPADIQKLVGEGKNVSLLVISSILAVRPLFIYFYFVKISAFWLDCLSIRLDYQPLFRGLERAAGNRAYLSIQPSICRIFSLSMIL